MKLDFVERTGAYTLSVPRSDAVDIKSLVEDHGLNFSSTASNVNEAVLFSREPFAAVTFREAATPGALIKLKPIIERIDASQALTSGAHIKCPADQELWSFQKASISYALNQNRTLVADQPG